MTESTNRKNVIIESEKQVEEKPTTRSVISLQEVALEAYLSYLLVVTELYLQ